MADVTLTLDESDTQLLCLSLALASLLRPGFTDALERIAMRAQPRAAEALEMTRDFRAMNAPTVRPQPFG